MENSCLLAQWAFFVEFKHQYLHIVALQCNHHFQQNGFEEFPRFNRRLILYFIPFTTVDSQISSSLAEQGPSRVARNDAIAAPTESRDRRGSAGATPSQHGRGEGTIAAGSRPGTTSSPHPRKVIQNLPQNRDR
jgi:hypothetical protein